MSLHYVLDGYNIIKQTHFSGKRLKDGRNNLVRFIDTLRPHGSRQNKITVVFDGKRDVFSLSPRSEARVVFTKYQSADEWIKGFIEKAAQPKEFIVVTDDKEIKFFVRALGARIVSVKDFINRVKNKFISPQDEEKFLSSEAASKITKELEGIWLKKD